jgi:hypothetical protein
VTAADITPAVIEAALNAMFHGASQGWRTHPQMAARARGDMHRALTAAFRAFQREKAQDVPS